MNLKRSHLKCMDKIKWRRGNYCKYILIKNFWKNKKNVFLNLGLYKLNNKLSRCMVCAFSQVMLLLMPMHLIAFSLQHFKVLSNEMKLKKQRAAVEFYLLWLTDDHKKRPLLFIMFLSIFLVTILGNLLITTSVSSYSHTCTAM